MGLVGWFRRRELAGLLVFICACVAGMTACQDSQRETVVFSGERSVLRGGDPVLGTGHEELCATAIAAIVRGDSVGQYLSDPLLVGPGFAQAIAGDQAKFPYGKAILGTGDFRGHRVYLLSFGVMGDEVIAMFKSRDVQACLRGFVSQKAEPATNEERELYYSLIGWEIAGEPVTVIRDGTRTLLLHATDGRLFWMDLIDQYPVRSVAGSVGEAVKLIEEVNRNRP